MTITVIVACENGFYIIADTLTQSDVSFSLNTQKVFFSQKHRIGMCIAGDEDLKFPGVTDEKDVLHTSYVINDFFKYIDTLSVFLVENLRAELTTFFQAKYSQYYAQFLDQVSYFFGGFKTVGADKVTAIYSHHNGRDEEYMYAATDQTPNCFFANTDAVQLALDVLAPQQQERRKMLVEQAKQKLAFTVVALACVTINAKHPCGIGELLHCVSLTKDGNCVQHAFNYESDLPYPKIIGAQPLPQYLLYPSLKESNEAFLNGTLSRYHLPTKVNQDEIPCKRSEVVAANQEIARLMVENAQLRQMFQTRRGAAPKKNPQAVPQQMFGPAKKLAGAKAPLPAAAPQSVPYKTAHLLKKNT